MTVSQNLVSGRHTVTFHVTLYSCKAVSQIILAAYIDNVYEHLVSISI